MRPSLSAALLAFVASGVSAQAQARVAPPATAFPAAITTSVGFIAFAPRYDQATTGADYSFGSSLALGLRGDYPLTRRLGLLAEVMVAPLAKQRSEHPELGRTVYDKIIVYGFHAGIGGRLKPGAPVFFQLGGGLTSASKHAFPEAEGTPMEPHAGFTIGYDASVFGRSNIRLTYSGRFASPDAPDEESIESKSMVFDHVVQVGLRYVPSRTPVRRARP